ncbi:MAG: agmatine deiminase family protein [Fibrobacterota bacterium]
MLLLKCPGGLPCVLALIVCAVISVTAQSNDLTHQLSPAEKQQMPQYLQRVTPNTAAQEVPDNPRSIAEFEPVKAVLIAYTNEFGFSLNLVRELTAVTQVMVMVPSYQHNSARAALQNHAIPMDSITMIIRETDSYWTRDYGPWCIDQGDTTMAIVDFTYNRPRYNDNGVPAAMAEYFDMPLYSLGLVHCGGNYMSSSGTDAVSTDLVLEENTSLSEDSIRSAAESYLGIDTYHITPDPLGDYIKHVDCWGKYLGPDRILIGDVTGSQKENYDSVAAYFEQQISPVGTPYEVHRVYTDGEPYTNSIIVNDHVFVPIMGTENDSAALKTYRSAMPGYTVVGVENSSSNPWQSTDALHCRVKGVSDPQMLRVVHAPRRDTTMITGMNDTIRFEIEDFSKTGINLSTSSLQFRLGETDEIFNAPMQKKDDGTWFSVISFADTGFFDVSYAVRATNNADREGAFPLMGMADPCFYTAHITEDNTETIDSVEKEAPALPVQVKDGILHVHSAGLLQLYTPTGRQILHKKLSAGERLTLPAEHTGAVILSFTTERNHLRRVLLR